MPKTADQALFEVLSAHEGLGGLLGGTGSAMKCYPVEAPQGVALPLLVYQVIGVEDQTSHGQGLADDERIEGVRFQLTALADTQLAAAGILYQAQLAIESSEALRGVKTDERSVPRAEEAQSHGRSADFLIWNDPDAD